MATILTITTTYLFFKLWVTGGDNMLGITGASYSTEFIDLNGTTLGPDLVDANLVDQWRFAFHCISYLNESHSILMGGYYNNTKSLIVNINSFEMTKGPDLTGNGRHSHACAQIKHVNGSNFVIVVGGFSKSYYLSSSEVLDAENPSKGWSTGKHSEANQFKK